MIPPNIKEEIEKESQDWAKELYPMSARVYSLDANENINVLYLARKQLEETATRFATQFYLKALGDRDAIAKAAFEAGRKMGKEIQMEVLGDKGIGRDLFRQKYATPDDYLASNEYKKLVGE